MTFASGKEEVMAQQTCPNCGTRFSDGERWARGALSVLIPAPAIRDMATQTRCPTCGHVIVDSEVRYLAASRTTLAWVLVAIACVLVAIWTIA